MRDKKIKMNWKFYVALLSGIVIIIAVIVCSHLKTAKYNQAAEDRNKKVEKELDTEKNTENPKGFQSKERQLPENILIEISNRKEVVDPIMGAWSYRLNEGITYYIQEHDLEANQAICLDCAVSKGSSSIVEIYLKLNDDSKTLLTAFYDSNEKSIEVDSCQYTEKEIEKKVWETEAPLIRDVQ